MISSSRFVSSRISAFGSKIGPSFGRPPSVAALTYPAPLVFRSRSAVQGSSDIGPASSIAGNRRCCADPVACGPRLRRWTSPASSMRTGKRLSPFSPLLFGISLVDFVFNPIARDRPFRKYHEELVPEADPFVDRIQGFGADARSHAARTNNERLCSANRRRAYQQTPGL